MYRRKYRAGHGNKEMTPTAIARGNKEARENATPGRRRTCKSVEPERTTNPRGRRTYKDEAPEKRHFMSDARRVRFGEKITSEAAKGRLLLILILIISARAQNVKESGFEFCNFTVLSMQTTL